MKRFMLYLVLLIAGVMLGIALYQAHKPLPKGLSFMGQEQPAPEVAFLRDLTWVDKNGKRHLDQQIFDEVLSMIRRARKFILLDMFLFNDFSGPINVETRSLAEDVSTALIDKKKKNPDIRIILLTDPINTVYGGLDNFYLERLNRAGIIVGMTRLEDLRDSNFFYSPIWRLFIRPFGNGPGSLLPNPFGAGRVSVRSYLRMFNFKANHRKLIVADDEDGFAALVTSANPHDSSSAHGNVGLKFTGQAVLDVVASEQAVPGVLPGKVPGLENRLTFAHAGPRTVQLLTEGKIKDVLLAELLETGNQDRVGIVMLYLSDREVITALKDAHQRGALVRILLDQNKDAFGIPKNGIPNRQVAAELIAAGVEVRWGKTNGEQLHSKLVLIDRVRGDSFLMLGSANLTRRNLNDFNLETDVAVRGQRQDNVMNDARQYLDLLWDGQGEKVFSGNYAENTDLSLRRKIMYRCMEATGMCTF